MTISIILLCFNSSQWIRTALVSVLSQTVSVPCEVIICDDGSSDNTVSIVEDMIASYSGPFHILFHKHPQNLGLHGNNNWMYALSRVRGEYTCQLDADDYWNSTNCIQDRYDYLKSNPTVVLVSDGYISRTGCSENIVTVPEIRLVTTESNSPHYPLLGSCMWRTINPSNIDEELLAVGYNDDCLHYALSGQLYAYKPTVSLTYRKTGEGIATGLSDVAFMQKKHRWFSHVYKRPDYNPDTYHIDLVEFSWMCTEECIELRHHAGIRYFALHLVLHMLMSRRVKLYWLLKYLFITAIPHSVIAYKEFQVIRKS